MMKTIKVTNRIIDVFFGDGWENWSRWSVANGNVEQIGGKKAHAIVRFNVINSIKK